MFPKRAERIRALKVEWYQLVPDMGDQLKRLLQLSAVLVLALGCAEDGIETSASAELHYQLSVIDSIGIELGESDYMLGTFVMCCDSSGDILVLDTTARSLRKYTSTGEHILTITIEGSGPGEFMSPDEIAPLPGGGFIIGSRADRKIAFYDGDMEFIREICNTSGSVMGPIRSLAVNDTTVLCSFNVFLEDSVSGVLSVHSASLGEPDAVIQRNTVVLGNNPDWQDEIWFSFSVSPEGIIYSARQDCFQWKISRFTIEGTMLSPIERVYEPVPVSYSEILHDRDIYLRRYTHAHGTAAGSDYIPPRYRHAVEGLFTDYQGRLWVQSGGRLTPGFDVYSQEGDSLFHCTFSAPAWQLYDEWRFSMDRGGFLAAPANPECFPVLYMVECESIPHTSD